MKEDNQIIKIKDECTPGNCPFAIDNDPYSLHRGWGMGPEGWKSAKEKHQNHCKHNTCPNCGLRQ